jgi:hypothetical protein
MQFARIAGLFLIALSLTLTAESQSLGSVAKKEKERRDKNKKEGVAAREIREDEVFGKKENGGSSGSESEESSEPAEASSGETGIPGLKPGADDKGAEQFEKESRGRQKSEAEWRARVSASKARIAGAKEQVRFYEELFLPPNGRYVDAHGNTVIESLDHLKRLTAEAKAELAEAEADWKRTQDEARKAGVPPGWLR